MADPIPPLHIQGGDAAPSGVDSTNQIKFGSNFLNVTSGSGLFLSIALIIGSIIYYKTHKK